MGRFSILASRCRRAFAPAICVFVAIAAIAGAAFAASTGKVQGRLVATDDGEPVGFADVVLLPADTTLHPVGALSNADGTFLLVAPPGRYRLRIRALSYATREIADVVVTENQLVPLNIALTPEAIQVKEVVIEAKAMQNSETAMLAARRKAAAVGDAVSAEQVRRAPDKDAAEVLRRVTGLSVSDGKYVFVRGLGERYSSTEVDGVRIASPEMNKRVVPLDLLPANLLENIVVQKTYTADRPGEFGGGDVQVHTRDFPGHRTWSLSAGQGALDGTTGEMQRVYAGANANFLGFGADSREMPSAVKDTPIPALNPRVPSTYTTVASMAKAFGDSWGPRGARANPNASYSGTYGDQFKIFGRDFGVISSWSYNRSYKDQRERQRFYEGGADAIKYDYDVDRSTASAQLGGITGLSYRLSPRHSLHFRGLFTQSADDEVRVYEGTDYNSLEAITNTPLVRRNTRFLYVERSVLSGAVEGKHEFSRLLGSSLDWKFTRSFARRLQPDRREYVYNRQFYQPDPTIDPHWVFASVGGSEFGDVHDQGWGTTIGTSVPWEIRSLGKGKLALGYDRQTKARDNFYRRFNLIPNQNVDREAGPDTIFAPGGFNGTPNETGSIEDATSNTAAVGLDNYRGSQRIEAGYLSADLPFGPHLRGNAGVRVEHGFQDVQSFALFQPGRVLTEGKLDDTDWLPSGNLTASFGDRMSLRVAGSRTISRPDLNELSSSPFLEYIGGMLAKGNPDLRRAVIENYDARFEFFPSLSEVLAAGVFYKDLHHPIEQLIRGGTPHILSPVNSERGHDVGLELEARAALGRIAGRLKGLSVNSNLSFISSEVQLSSTSKLGSEKHPLQGQANSLLNAALVWSKPGGHTEASVLVARTGRRLVALATLPLPDIYEEPSTTVDASVNFAPIRNARVKLSGKNLFDWHYRQVQDGNDVVSYYAGRSVAIALSYGQ